MSNLLMHCGGKHVSRDDLANASTPAKIKTWVPVSHHRLLELVDQTIEGQGFHVTSEAHGLWGNGARYFGLMELPMAMPRMAAISFSACETAMTKRSPHH